MGEISAIGMPLTDLKAEVATLGAMLVSDGHPLDCRDLVADKLREAGAEAFYDPDHKLIYQAIIDCLMNDRPTDPVSVVSQLRNKGELTQSLFDLVHELPRSAGLLTSAADDAGTILDLYRKRELHRELLDCDSQILKAAGSYEEIAGEVSGRVMSLVDQAVQVETQLTAPEVTDEALGHLFGEREVVPGIPMGIADLDELTGGMKPGQYIIFAGRPGMGKTTIGAQVARNTSNAGIPTAVFSLEMGRVEYGQRDASAETGIPFAAIRDGKVDAEGLERLAEYASRRENVPFILDDNPNQTVGEICLKIRKLVKTHGVKVVVLDYVQICPPDGGWSGNKTEDVARVSQTLRAIARKLDIVLIVLAQLNRESTNRENNRPRVSDLRESGQLEQDAHKIILVHLPFKVDPQTERGRQADFFLDKNRDGPTREVVMVFDGEHSRFLDQSMVVGGGL